MWAKRPKGLQRFPINIRYPRELRDSVEKLNVLPIVTEAGATTTLSAVADLVVTDGPPQIRSENARLNGWVYVDISGHDLGRYVRQAQQLVAERVKLPPGYSITLSGQFEYLERATKKLTLVVPVTLAIIFVLLYLTFRNLAEAGLIMVTLPFALVGGLWLLFLLGYLSIASAIGFIALAGVSEEFGVVMLIYLDHAIAKHRTASRFNTETPGVHRISRKDLYELIWSEPTTTLAQRFGISDVGLAKVCRRSDIPAPPRRYWAKIAAGNSIPRPDLPERADLGSRAIIFRINRDHRSDA